MVNWVNPSTVCQIFNFKSIERKNRKNLLHLIFSEHNLNSVYVVANAYVVFHIKGWLHRTNKISTIGKFFGKHLYLVLYWMHVIVNAIDTRKYITFCADKQLTNFVRHRNVNTMCLQHKVYSVHVTPL